MSILPWSVAVACTFWPIALALSVPVAVDVPVLTLPVALFPVVGGVPDGLVATDPFAPVLATEVPLFPTVAFWSLLFCGCGGPGAPAGVEGVGSAWAPVGGGALCESVGGGGGGVWFWFAFWPAF